MAAKGKLFFVSFCKRDENGRKMTKWDVHPAGKSAHLMTKKEAETVLNEYLSKGYDAYMEQYS